MDLKVGRLEISDQDLEKMFLQVKSPLLERIHYLEEKVKELQGCKCGGHGTHSDAWIGQIDEDCG